ncbi:Multidrug transporter MdtA [Hartmannibacter diazotrophicus]|uniref:Multidrug transporter MdtA n=1 Tax=Hartmannibacter diazotrophicus TaxID=1482074 RepID=A0A2C9DD73_9HYPH|nr:efflux RND transporter periplasmic adaptor subunit [Hartmannibacter diazotrophicus]SON58120.1 Multidrug transporter MdtA [Hartmannibacter diazotrophicus]
MNVWRLFGPAVAVAVLLAPFVPGSVAGAQAAGTYVLEPMTTTEWKAVYGRIEARDTVPARARIGGTLLSLEVTEGDTVAVGQKIASVHDDKIAFQIDALDAQLRALGSQLDNARTELERGQSLLARGVVSTQRLDQLRTEVDVFTNQVASTEAQRQVLKQQLAEGDVLAPTNGRVLAVPVTRGGFVQAGETVATVGGGGVFLRLAIPERHAVMLKTGADLEIETANGTKTGRLAKIYPLIENGRVIADVEVQGLDTAFIDARLLVRVPVGERHVLAVPTDAIRTVRGIDMVDVNSAEGPIERAVVTGGHFDADGKSYVEVLSGLEAGSEIVLP